MLYYFEGYFYCLQGLCIISYVKRLVLMSFTACLAFSHKLTCVNEVEFLFKSYVPTAPMHMICIYLGCLYRRRWVTIIKMIKFLTYYMFRFRFFLLQPLSPQRAPKLFPVASFVSAQQHLASWAEPLTEASCFTHETPHRRCKQVLVKRVSRHFAAASLLALSEPCCHDSLRSPTRLPTYFQVVQVPWFLGNEQCFACRFVKRRQHCQVASSPKGPGNRIRLVTTCSMVGWRNDSSNTTRRLSWTTWAQRLPAARPFVWLRTSIVCSSLERLCPLAFPLCPALGVSL